MSAKIKNKHIVILGGLGFIGKNLGANLLSRGAKVRIADLAVDKKKAEAAAKIKNLELVKFDILDRKSIRKVLKGKADIVFNLAGHSGPKASLDKPYLDTQVNVLGALNVLEEVKPKKNTVLVFMGSRLEYGPKVSLPVSEEAAINSETIYGVNKFAAGAYHLLYHKLYGVKAIVLRGTNPYGPHVYNSNPQYNIINFFMDRAVSGNTINIYKDVQNDLKDYIYIEDFCEALIESSFSRECVGQVFNVGSGKGIKFKDAAEKIVKTIKKGKVKVMPNSKVLAKAGSGNFVADISKIKYLLNWKPKTNFESGIKRTIEEQNAEGSILYELLNI